MEIGLFLIFWYGVLHAFGADHLTAIIDFSIGKSKKKTFLITFAFAIGHGIMLFIFAKILSTFMISDEILKYGDIISALVIIVMGLYLLYLVISNNIYLNKHMHNGEEHIHISYSKEHKHNNKDTTSALTIGMLMGIGGVRGMLITLGAIESSTVDITLILTFVAGVSVVFILFGYVVNYINKNVLNNEIKIKRMFTTAGIISILVGSNILLG